jgi:hypothetical protein
MGDGWAVQNKRRLNSKTPMSGSPVEGDRRLTSCQHFWAADARPSGQQELGGGKGSRVREGPGQMEGFGPAWIEITVAWTGLPNISETNFYR